jgi:hypothetical protein
MDLKCETCGRNFVAMQNLQKHITKNACKIFTNFCRYCGKGFTTPTSMYRHIRLACKVKKQDEQEKKHIYNKLVKLAEENKKLRADHKKDMDELRKTISVIQKGGNGNGNGNVNNIDNSINNQLNNNIDKQINNTNNGVVANIILVGYGKEDMSKIDKNEMLNILRNGFNSTIKLTEEIHFNKKHPEYHNIYISNIKDKYAMIYDGKDWNIRNKDDVINMIYDDKKNYIEENLEEFVGSMTESRRKALDRWLATDDNDKKITRVKDEIKLLLYNKRVVAIETQNIIDANEKCNSSKTNKKINSHKIIKDAGTSSTRDFDKNYENIKGKKGRPKSVTSGAKINNKNILVPVRKINALRKCKP